MGSDSHYPEEAPAHSVRVNGFWMDRFAVTNAAFKRFVDATGHVTLAERPANPDDYPGAKPELLAPSSVMFKKAAGPVDLTNHYNWWTYTAGADWRHPRGPESSLQGLWDHPVVHIAFADAQAYANYVTLTESDIKSLVVDDKWLAALDAAIHGEIDRVSQQLTQRVKELAERYETPLPQIIGGVTELESKVNCHLRKMGFSWT